MAWIAAAAALAGGAMSANSANNAAKGMQYRPWDVNMSGLGTAGFENGNLNMSGDTRFQTLQDQLGRMQYGQLQGFNNSQAQGLGQDFLRSNFDQANYGSQGALNGLMGAFNQAQGMQMPGIQSGLPQGLQNLGMFGGGGAMPNSFFGSGTEFQGNANLAQGLSTNAMQQAGGGYGGQNYMQAGQSFLNPYQQQNFGNLRGNMLSGFDPNQAASQYTDMLRQQAQPQEQQAAASALTKLHGRGRLGTTGGMNAYQGLMDSQNQADLGRQIAGQQHGLQQQLMAQQGLDSALNNEQGRQLGAFGANQQGMMNQYGIAQGLGQTGAGLMGSAMGNAGMAQQMAQGADAFGFNRLMGLNDTQFNRGYMTDQTNADRSMYNNQLGMNVNQMGFDRSMAMNQNAYNQMQGNYGMANQLYTASNSATQDRFMRAMQMFGGDNAIQQQYLSNFSGLLGAQQGQNQQLMDLSRIGASVGQAQTTAGANAAMMRNQGNQDMIAGFLGAMGSWARDREGGG
jgi:hypothetical protein